MKVLASFGLAAIALSSVALGAPVPKADPVTIVEEIIAKVNGEIVTRGELERNLEQLRAEYQQRGLEGAKLEEAVQTAEKDLLRNEIDQLLLVHST